MTPPFESPPLLPLSSQQSTAMPVTESQLRERALELIEAKGKPVNRNEWYWEFVADPETYVQAHETGELYIGQKECEPMYAARGET